ncbi:hypothetical protein M408DRAFT_25227 [Serendipita vermifera MAFF 305830]|uniref:Casein kinase substrate phosphoprotein PP28 domain-containing protein n=1 Tax=Serendipita vermifera MAFF 305830 TaxID=933852 RepID=A0A0C2XBH1_SERVB|nr:hypothetical protein M408DRAFT_25227 [Serendipita vermifera MAFF 305830]
MTRAPGKYKQKRGGGRSFSKNLTLDENGIAVSADARGKKRRDDDSDDEDEDDEEEEEEEESEEEDEDEEPEIELSRAERKALKKQGKQPPAVSEEDKDLINPNRQPVKNLTISDIGAPRELSRREREAKEKAEAKEKYWKLHQAGKTDEAKSDMARLAKIRQEREAASAARKAAEEQPGSSTR